MKERTKNWAGVIAPKNSTKIPRNKKKKKRTRRKKREITRSGNKKEEKDNNRTNIFSRTLNQRKKAQKKKRGPPVPRTALKQREGGSTRKLKCIIIKKNAKGVGGHKTSERKKKTTHVQRKRGVCEFPRFISKFSKICQFDVGESNLEMKRVGLKGGEKEVHSGNPQIRGRKQMPLRTILGLVTLNGKRKQKPSKDKKSGPFHQGREAKQRGGRKVNSRREK